MPSARPPRRRTSPRQVVVLGVVGVVVGVALLLGLSVLSSRGDVTINLGDRTFEAGRTDSQAAAIERDGPAIFSDVAGGDQDIYLQHVGDDGDTGWFAFDARAPGAEESCVLEADGDDFVDPCSDERYPPDGEGLTQYPVRVVDGRLSVDLQRPRPPSP